jgi:hypothetical protein
MEPPRTPIRLKGRFDIEKGRPHGLGVQNSLLAGPPFMRANLYEPNLQHIKTRTRDRLAG